MTYVTDAFQVSATERHESPRSLNDIKAVEISFEEHDIYVGERGIAKIILTDEDFETQPWIVIVNGIEIHRANTWMKCFHFVTWHFKQGTLPQQKEKIIATEKEGVALPIFIPQQKSKQFITATNLVQKVYAKCFDTLQMGIQYLLRLLRVPAKSFVKESFRG